MAKRLCKLNRHDIQSSMGQIKQLVASPKFVCRNCARSSAEKERLCRSDELRMSKSGLSKQKLSATLKLQTAEYPVARSSKAEEKSLKQARKQLKKQKKYHKKLKKLVKKQQALLKKHQVLEIRVREFNERIAKTDTASLHAFH